MSRVVEFWTGEHARVSPGSGTDIADEIAVVTHRAHQRIDDLLISVTPLQRGSKTPAIQSGIQQKHESKKAWTNITVYTNSGSKNDWLNNGVEMAEKEIGDNAEERVFD